jgi:hypothetical protein
MGILADRGGQLKRVWASGVSSGPPILIVDIAAEETRSSAGGSPESCRAGGNPDEGATCRPNGSATQHPLFGI